MAITYEDVADIAPEILVETEDQQDRVTRFIERAKAQVSASVFGSMYDMAVLYLAAHLITISGADGARGQAAAAGSISSVQTGDASVSYNSSGAALASHGTTSLYSTAYGQEYLRIRQSSVYARATVANSSIKF